MPPMQKFTYACEALDWQELRAKQLMQHCAPADWTLWAATAALLLTCVIH